MENINEENDLREYLLNSLLKSEIKVEDKKITQMLEFLELLYKKNQVMNLTAIRDKKGMMEKHFIDSLLLTKIIRCIHIILHFVNNTPIVPHQISTRQV